jgi:uncharacterized membrane protein YqaE (UPF0057 family)
MKEKSEGAERIGMIFLAIVAPWIAVVLDGGSTMDFVICLVSTALGFYILCVPQIYALTVVLRRNDTRQVKAPKAFLHQYRM